MDEIVGIFILSGPEIEPRQITLPRHGILTIGRTADNDLPLNNPQISRKHMRIMWEDGGFYVEDLNSRNGVSVDGERLREPNLRKRLIEGARIQFGPFLLRYERLTTLPSAQPDEHMSASASSNGGSDGGSDGGVGVGSGGEPYPVPQIQYPMGGNDGNGAGGVLQGYRPTPPAGSSTPAVPPGRPGTKFRQARVGDRVTYRSPVNNGLVAQSKLRAYALELPTERSNWLQYLPAIFAESMVDHNGANHNDFLGRYLMIFETILNPITWIIDNLDLYLSPETAPDIWLEWLSSWFDILLVPELSLERKRDIQRQIDWLYLRRGTRLGMQRLLQLYFGVPVEIVESPDQPCEFEVRMPLDQSELALSDDLKSELAQQLIDSQKPGFTVGRLVDTSRQ